jgi:hypothetical protein
MCHFRHLEEHSTSYKLGEVMLTDKSTTPITFLCLHLLVDEVKGVNMARNITQTCEEKKSGHGRVLGNNNAPCEQEVDQ